MLQDFRIMGIKEIIRLTLIEVRDQGWDLIDEFVGGDEDTAVDMVYNNIKDKIY